MNQHKQLFRNKENKMLGGVAAGFAQYFELDVTLVRVLFVIAVFIPISFPIVFAYLVLWMVMPTNKENPQIIRIDQGEKQ